MNSDQLIWRQSVPGEMVSSNEVHVWRANLDFSSLQIENPEGILSADELARAGKFHFERDQMRFIAARGILRTILGHYLGKKPNKICFEYTSFGKPVLATIPGNDAISFNVSHSGEIALYAITSCRKVGIDVERIRENVDLWPIANRFFSYDEISSLERIDKKNQCEGFFQYWVRKEAFIKAMGEGISFPMEQCDVSSIKGKIWTPIKLSVENREPSRWYAQDLFPGDGYTAAIAIEGGDLNLSCWHYSLLAINITSASLNRNDL